MQQGLYVIGGQQRSQRALFADDQTWYEYQKGLILEVDTESKSATTRLEYISPTDVRGANDPVIFKAGTLEDNRLYVCTQTEVMVYTLPDFTRVLYMSLPCFNDVHHVRLTPQHNLLIANSGLDMVIEISPQGDILKQWNVLGQQPWVQFSQDIDYRIGVSTKPHKSHPNYLFYVDGEPWATRFQQKDAVCLNQQDKRIQLSKEHVHDGVVRGDLIYFTAVDGHIIVANVNSLTIEAVIDLNAMAEPHTLLGWCRGIYLDGDKIWVGFTRIRPTRFREAVSWVRQGFSRALPSHIACYDLVKQTHIVDIDLEQYGLNAVFSILPTPNLYSARIKP